MFYTPGKWHRFVLKVNISYNGGGYLGLWWDGDEIYDQAVPFGYDRFSDGSPPLVAHGPYRQNSESNLTIDFQHFEVSTTSLASRIANPLPI
jgi:hypothetical protein